MGGRVWVSWWGLQRWRMYMGSRTRLVKVLAEIHKCQKFCKVSELLLFCAVCCVASWRNIQHRIARVCAVSCVASKRIALRPSRIFDFSEFCNIWRHEQLVCAVSWTAGWFSRVSSTLSDDKVEVDKVASSDKVANRRWQSRSRQSTLNYYNRRWQSRSRQSTLNYYFVIYQQSSH